MNALDRQTAPERWVQVTADSAAHHSARLDGTAPARAKRACPVGSGRLFGIRTGQLVSTQVAAVVLVAGAVYGTVTFAISAMTAVVMLADGIEAAARVLHEPTPEKVREVVEHIVRQRIDQGQLIDAPLTLRQIEIIKEEFIRVLVGMYHNRIDYPTASGGITSEFASV